MQNIKRLSYKGPKSLGCFNTHSTDREGIRLSTKKWGEREDRDMCCVNTDLLLRQQQKYKLTLYTFKLESGKFWCTLGQKPLPSSRKEDLMELGRILYCTVL